MAWYGEAVGVQGESKHKLDAAVLDLHLLGRLSREILVSRVCPAPEQQHSNFSRATSQQPSTHRRSLALTLTPALVPHARGSPRFAGIDLLVRRAWARRRPRRRLRRLAQLGCRARRARRLRGGADGRGGLPPAQPRPRRARVPRRRQEGRAALPRLESRVLIYTARRSVAFLDTLDPTRVCKDKITSSQNNSQHTTEFHHLTSVLRPCTLSSPITRSSSSAVVRPPAKLLVVMLRVVGASGRLVGPAKPQPPSPAARAAAGVPSRPLRR